MNKNTKIILISIAAITGAASLYFGVRYYILQSAYNTTLDTDNTNQVIQDVTSNITAGDIIPDGTSANADAPKGTNATSGSDNSGN